MDVIKTLIDNEIRLKSLNYKRDFFENFYQFNKETGLGRAYRNIELKIRICNRIINSLECT